MILKSNVYPETIDTRFWILTRGALPLPGGGGDGGGGDGGGGGLGGSGGGGEGGGEKFRTVARW